MFCLFKTSFILRLKFYINALFDIAFEALSSKPLSWISPMEQLSFEVANEVSTRQKLPICYKETLLKNITVHVLVPSFSHHLVFSLWIMMKVGLSFSLLIISCVPLDPT